VFYRVDYTLALILAGVAIGAIAPARRWSTPQLARAFYVFVAVTSVARTLATIPDWLGGVHALHVAGQVVGDAANLGFGALFGLATRRRELLAEPAIAPAMCLALAFTYTLAALGKAFALAGMTAFFAQSGYSTTFLWFIVLAEGFGAIGLLVPWLVGPAVVGLAIDMFGAIATHVHNGDPLDDSTGAIALLVRLTALGVVLLLPRTTPRRTLIVVAVGAAACCALAFAGSVAVRTA